MNKDEIWQEIKNDKSLVYNEPIFDVFLQTTEKINLNHYSSLNKDEKKLLKPNLRIQMAINYSGAEGKNSPDWVDTRYNLQEELDVIESAISQVDKYQILSALSNIVISRNLNLLDYFLNNKKVIKVFSSELTNTNERMIQDILDKAIANNVVEVIKHLNEQNKLNSLSDSQIINAFAFSIENGYEKVVEYLFSEVLKNEKYILEIAIKNSHNPTSRIYRAIKDAGDLNRFSIIKFLVDNDFSGAGALEGMAKTKDRFEGHLDLFKKILEKMDFKNPEHSRILDKTFQKAAANNNIDILDIIKEIVGPNWNGFIHQGLSKIL